MNYTAEEIKALYFDKNALIEPDYRLYRVNMGGDGRYYYTIVKQPPDFKEDKIVYMPGVTTIIQFTTAMSPYLLDWYINLGRVRAKELMNRLALYGTLMHKAKAEYTISRLFDLNKQAVTDYVHAFIEKEGIDFNTDNWIKNLQNDITAWRCFCKDFQIRPIAVEVGLKDKKNRWGGTMDDVFYMVIGQGQNAKTRKKDKPEEIIAVCDAKSGRHGFYEGHEIQVEGFYRPMWNENYPHLKATRSFNWSPKEIGKSESNYLLKDQTDLTGSRVMEASYHYGVYMIRHFKTPKKVTIFHGELKGWNEPDGNNVINMQLDKYLLSGGSIEPEIVTALDSEENIDELI
jgi:hypothetical protein